jgi:hypothetical protein
MRSMTGGRRLRRTSLVLAVLAFSAASGAALAQEVVLRNIRFGTPAILYEAPQLVVRGSRLSEAELTRLLDPGSPEPWADRIMKLEAEEMLAPELITTVKVAQMDQRTTYRDVSLKRIAGGKISSVTSSLGAMEGTQQGRKVTGSNGAFSLRDIDAGAVASLMTAKAGPAEPFRRIHGAYSLDGTKVIDSTGITTEIGRISGSGFSAKPTAMGWLAILNTFSAVDPGDKSSVAGGKVLAALAEAIDSVSIEGFEMSGVSMKGRVEKDDVDLDISMGRMSYAGAGSGRGGEFKIEDSRFVVGDARAGYGSLTFSGLDAKPMVLALREIALNPDNPSPAVLRRLLPIISSIRVENVDVDIPAADKKEPSAMLGERLRFGLGRFEIAAEKPVNGIPSDLRIVLRNVGVPVPPNPSDPGFAMLAQLGYPRIEGSLGINLGWNETGQEIVLREVSVDGKDMGTATLRGVIGKVGRDIFNEDTAVASVALLGAAARSVELTIDNRGLFERVIAREARRQKRPPEDVRREYGMAASVGIPVILGNSQPAKTLAQAVARFVAKPGKLTIQARAKQQAGYGVADYMANPTLGGILEAIDVTATAE